MKVKTKSFNLSVIAKGNKNASKLAIVIPGRLDSKDYANVVSHLTYLSKKGFYAVSFDPPGTWESEGNISIYTTTNYIKVVNEIIEYYGNKPTLLIGHSRGGSVSMLCGSNPNVIGIVCIMASYGKPSPPSKEAIKAGCQISYRDLPPGNKKTPKQKTFKLPLNYFKDGRKYSPVKSLMKLSKPKLMIYSESDEFVKIDMIKEENKEMPEPKMISEIYSEHEYRYNKKIIEEVNNTIGEFLDKYF
jgi:hypothetical protein